MTEPEVPDQDIAALRMAWADDVTVLEPGSELPEPDEEEEVTEE